jgi:glycosyltransferase involved in cell wall biosynthesis
MAALYSLIDCYIVSSNLEGGPKAIIECLLCKTPVLSSKVGVAPDILEPALLYACEDEFVLKLSKLMQDELQLDITKSITKAQYYNSCEYQTNLLAIINKYHENPFH